MVGVRTSAPVVYVRGDWSSRVTVVEDATCTASQGQWHLQRTGGLHLSDRARAGRVEEAEGFNELATSWIRHDTVKVHIDYAHHHHQMQAKTQAIMSAGGVMRGCSTTQLCNPSRGC